MKYKLLVLDLDGTLTNSKKKITDRTRNTLIEAQKRGVKIVLASGRPTYGVAPLANALELNRYEGYILSYNGGEIIDWKTGELMYKKWLENDILPYLYKCAKENGFPGFRGGYRGCPCKGKDERIGGRPYNCYPGGFGGNHKGFYSPFLSL